MVRKTIAGLIALILTAGPGEAAQTHIAIAANFTEAAKDIAVIFKQKTGHEVVMSFGASGQLYTQITQDAPFQVLMSADEERPRQAIADGFGIAESRFTYAIGRLVLWSRSADLVKGETTLTGATFTKIAIANPATAPYGVAAVEIMKKLGIDQALSPKIVQGNSIAQTFQFVDSGNAEVGLIALSQIARNTTGSRWVVPQTLYTPIRQDAVLLKKGVGNDAAVAFMAFLKSPEARAIIETYGYALDTPR